MNIVGIDEAGRGPVLGPLVMCGISISESHIRKLVNIGVKDSKLLLPKKREELYAKLQQIVEGVHIVIIEPREIDAALFRNDFNLNMLEAVKTAEIIQHLRPDRAVVDCPSPNIKSYQQELRSYVGELPVEIIAAHHADVDFPVVSAASIIAKVTRDAIIEDLKKLHAIDFGSGYLTDPKTCIFLEEQWDNPAYASLFRKSWQPWKRIKYSQGQMNLSGF